MGTLDSGAAADTTRFRTRGNFVANDFVSPHRAFYTLSTSAQTEETVTIRGSVREVILTAQSSPGTGQGRPSVLLVQIAGVFQRVVTIGLPSDDWAIQEFRNAHDWRVTFKCTDVAAVAVNRVWNRTVIVGASAASLVKRVAEAFALVNRRAATQKRLRHCWP